MMATGGFAGSVAETPAVAVWTKTCVALKRELGEATFGSWLGQAALRERGEEAQAHLIGFGDVFGAAFLRACVVLGIRVRRVVRAGGDRAVACLDEPRRARHTGWPAARR